MPSRPLLPQNWQVPETFRQRLGDKPGRQRAMAADGHLLLVLHRPPEPDESERVGRFFWRQPDGTWLSTDLGPGPNALARHLTQFDELIAKLDRREEEASGVSDYFTVIELVTPLARTTRNLHVTLQEGRNLCPDDRDLLNLRDRAYELERKAELLMTDARNGLDFAVARRADQQATEAHRMAVSAHRLNMLVAFFFPLATLAAFFGVNMQTGLEHIPAPWSLLGLLSVGLIAGLALQTFLRRGESAPRPPGSNDSFRPPK